MVRFAGEAALVALLRDGLEQDLAQFRGWSSATATAPLPRSAAAAARHLAASVFSGDGRTAGPPRFRRRRPGLSRGCEAHCGYCCVAGASDVAERPAARTSGASPAEIADEIAALYHERGVPRLQLHGRQPAAARRRTRALAWTAELGAELGARAGRPDRVLAAAARRRLHAVRSSTRSRSSASCAPTSASTATPGGSWWRSAATRRPTRAPDALAQPGRGRRLHGLQRADPGAHLRLRDRTRGDRGAGARPPRAGAPAPHRRARRQRLPRARPAPGPAGGGRALPALPFRGPAHGAARRGAAGLPTRLEEYSVPVALYDLGYNMGIARRLLPGARLDEACAIYATSPSAGTPIRSGSCAPPRRSRRAATRRGIGALRGAEERRACARLDDELRADANRAGRRRAGGSGRTAPACAPTCAAACSPP